LLYERFYPYPSSAVGACVWSERIVVQRLWLDDRAHRVGANRQRDAKPIS
jgi:hypothetical protein